MAKPVASGLRRAAVVSAATIEVCCPKCGEPQPEPRDGSHLWTSEQLKASAGQRRECVSCDAPMFLDAPNKVLL